MFGCECNAGQELLPLVAIYKALDSSFERPLGKQLGGLFRIGRAAARFFDHEIFIEQRAHRFHALRRPIPLDARSLL